MGPSVREPLGCSAARAGRWWGAGETAPRGTGGSRCRDELTGRRSAPGAKRVDIETKQCSAQHPVKQVKCSKAQSGPSAIACLARPSLSGQQCWRPPANSTRLYV